MLEWKKYLARQHQVSWQRDFFDHRLRDHQEVLEKTSYIEMNPVRKGLCERAEDWPWIIVRRIGSRRISGRVRRGLDRGEVSHRGLAR